MSGYEKSYVYGYDPSGRPTQEQDYSAYAHPSTSYGAPTQVPSTTQASEPHAMPHANQMPFLSTTYTPRDQSYPPPPPAYIPPRPRPTLDITSTDPYHGFVGEHLRITFKTPFEFNPLKHTFFVDFGGKTRVKARFYKDFYQEPLHHFLLDVEVPDLQGENQAMPLLLDVQDENALHLEHKSLGNFFYSSTEYQSYGTESRKRKFSEETSGFSHPSAKRSASQPLQPAKFQGSSKAFAVPMPGAPPYPTPLYAIPTDRSASQGTRYGQLSAQQRPVYGYAMSPNMGSPPIKAESPLLTSYGGTYQSLKQSSSPQLSQQGISGLPMRRTVTTASTPTWVRTTQQQSSSRAPGYGPMPTFNPYSQYPNSKAKLEIVGDLATMCENWTQAERAAGRRLVEFTRLQEGSKITASFRGVSPEQRTPNSPCVSCIYWAKKKQSYVTSVDTIALLEGLVAVRFTVEEKNRIRRNLEGFKPYTVSKNKDECDDIFRLIMGFPAPKPRNIEKDIKIFPWSILGHALKKIISKYSASYSSTSGPLGASTSSVEYGSTLPEATDLKPITASPIPSTGGTASLPFAGSMTSTAALSPSIGSASAGLNITGSPHDLRVSTSMPHLYGEAGHWPNPAGGPGYNAPAYTAALAASAPTRSWALEAAYLQSAAGAPAHSEAAGHPTSEYYRTSDDELLQQSTSSGSARQAGSSRYIHQTSRPQ